ncbi:MAG: hypothetical protein ACPKOI_03510 [Pleomorphochaeta sp.]
MILTHTSPEGKIDKIKSRNDDSIFLFDGIFASEGWTSDYTTNANFDTHFEIDDDLIAGPGDADLNYDETIKFLKKEYPNLNNNELEILYNLVAEDEDIRDCIEDDCTNIPFLPLKYKKHYEDREEALYNIDGDILSDLSWKFQNIRGQIAINQGFSAIAMSDEFGISFFIPYTAKYKIVKE